MRRYLSSILLITVLFVNIYFRMGSAFLPFTENRAKNSVINDFKKSTQKLIDERFKDLPPPAKYKAMQNLVDKWTKTNKSSINDAIRSKRKEIRSYWQDESGQTFLLEIDPYHWFRLVRNLITHGRIGDKVIDDVQYDSFMLAPVGVKVEPSLHKNLLVYTSSYLFRAARKFTKDISLMHFLFYLPVLMSSLALIAAFFMCFSLNQSKVNISGFFAALCLGLAPMYLQRSTAGWFDTDSYIVLFLLLSVWTFYLSLKDDSPLRVRSLFALASGISIGLFSFTWDGWWYIFSLIIFSAIYYICNLYLVKKNTKEKIDLRIPLISLCLFILSALICVGAFSGLPMIGRLLSEPVKVAFAKGYLQEQFWPNAFLTVKELQGTDFNAVVNDIGGIFIFIPSIVFLIFMLIDKRSRAQRQRQFIVVLFSFWILFISYAAMQASRFSLLLAVPLSISFGLYAEKAINLLRNLIWRYRKIPYLSLILSVIFCVIFMYAVFKNAFVSRHSQMGLLFNRDWLGALNKIRMQTPDNAIINSWWDYGHWFKAISERRVIFDGATQNTPMSYWMGRVFLTTNEPEALGILRMLNSGSNKAFEELERLGIDRLKCLDILNEVILLKRKDAQAALCKYVSERQTRDRILGYTHRPETAYLVVEPSLIGKMSSISFLGGWDFKKAAIYKKFRRSSDEELIDYLIKVLGFNKDDAKNIRDSLVFLDTDSALRWISPVYKYYPESSSYRKEDNLLFFDNGYIVDLDNYHVYFDDVKSAKWRIPESISYLKADELEELDFENSDMEVSVLLIEDKGNYKLIPFHSKLAKSMLTRLYYLRGLRLKYFSPFIVEELEDNKGSIIVYKVHWDESE